MVKKLIGLHPSEQRLYSVMQNNPCRQRIRNAMRKLFLSMLILSYSQLASASFLQYFKDEQGETKWQYVANFSSGVLILLLSAAFITLIISHRKVRKTNLALKEIKAGLEQRVQERTFTLDNSNQLLQESNLALEGEIIQHKQTTSQLCYSEAYIKDILESMPIMLIGLDKERRITQWNRWAEDISGISSNEAMGKNLWEAYPTITVSPNQINDVLKKNEATTIKHSQRGQYYFDITIYPLQEQSETGLVILIDNVSQRIVAENMLIQRDKMSSMGELASTMAYDINTPLQVILTDLQSVQHLLMRKDACTDAGKREEDIKRISALLGEAAEKGRQASGVVSNLLDFASSHSDNKRLANIPEIIEHTIELAADVLSEPSGLRFRDINIERSIEENLPEIRCYISELQQVFLSLFRHACHALGQISKPGFKPTIGIEIIECYDALWIKVQHNGAGLSSEEQQYIFEPFFNNAAADSVAGNSEFNENNGAEKRLSFSYFIITEHHQGQIAVTSNEDIGTTFHIQLQLD